MDNLKTNDEGTRIAKVLARAGVASRRDAEKLIEAGRVKVNGKVLTTPAFKVGPGARITVDGQPLPEVQDTSIWRFHKPKGTVTTSRDPEGRPTIFDELPDHLPRVISIGRLDLTTEGLLLLTNDGDLARLLEHPDTGWVRRYRVRVFGKVDEAALAGLSKGVTVEGVRYGPIEASLERVQGRNAWLNIAIREGKNREIRKVMAHLDLTVNRLIRVSYGPFQLGKLGVGDVEKVPARVLREQVGALYPAVMQGKDNTGDGQSKKHSANAKNRSKDKSGDKQTDRIATKKATKKPATRKTFKGRKT